MNDEQFRVLLDLFMVSDPWPLEISKHETMKDMLHEESVERGYDDWVHAYHEFDPSDGGGWEVIEYE